MSKDYKCAKYVSVGDDCREMFKDFNVIVHTIECTTLGHLSNIAKFCKLVLKVNNLPPSIYSNIVQTVVGNSYNIYKHRNDIIQVQ